MRLDIARRRERQETGKVAHGSLEFREATLIDLADESRESLYGRETDRDLRVAPRHVDASRDFSLTFSERSKWERG